MMDSDPTLDVTSPADVFQPPTARGENLEKLLRYSALRGDETQPNSAGESKTRFVHFHVRGMGGGVVGAPRGSARHHGHNGIMAGGRPLNPKTSINGFTKCFLVLLRIAIGWHVCYEGVTKIDPTWLRLSAPEKAPPKSWTAAMYLRNATGPARGFFREIVPDNAGFGQLKPEALESSWRQELADFASHFALDETQLAAAEKSLAGSLAKAQAHLETSSKAIDEYIAERNAWAERDANDFYGADKDLQAQWRSLEKKRQELVGPINGWASELRDELYRLLTDEQAVRPTAGPNWTRMTKLEQVDLTTMLVLSIGGAFMMVGLFSRLSSLAVAVMLGLFYFSMPPWPGLPPNPVTEGHYVIVNKTLIELLACLVLATVPTGVWGGLDAVIRGFVTRPLLGVGVDEVRPPDPDAV